MYLTHYQPVHLYNALSTNTIPQMCANFLKSKMHKPIQNNLNWNKGHQRLKQQ